MTIGEALREATARLRPVVARPRLEAEILLAHHRGVDRAFLLLRSEEILEDPEGFFSMIHRREAGEPVEYITGRVGFYGETFFIGPGALIPRPETELLVDRAAELIRREGIGLIAEIGVGSGALSVALAGLFPDLRIIATDISAAALAVAGENLRRFGLEERIELRKGSLLDPVHEAVSLIVSNPPYVAENASLEPNVRDYEPPRALFAPEEGTSLLREIALLGQAREIPVACEMGYDQREPMERFFRKQGIENYTFYRDLAGLDRGFVLS